MSFFVVLTLAGAALADVTISVPAAIQAKPGRLLRIEAQTTGKIVKWFVNDPDNADLIPIKAENAAIFCAPQSGSFRVFAYTAAGDQPSDPAVCVVTVGTPTPPPPPADPLTQALQAGYAADLVTTRAAKKPLLQALYYGAAQNLMRADYFNNAGEVYQNIETGRKRLISDADLANVRGTIQGYLNGKFPPTQALDSTTRAGLATEFTHIATALGSIN